AGALGLRAFGTGSRPATVASLATLSAVLRLPAEAIVEAIGPVLATAVGLAAAGLSDSVLGPNRARFVLVAVLCGTFVSQLAIGAAGIVALGLLVARSAPGLPLDTSADTVLRRLGLWSLLRTGWRETLVASLAILAPTAVVAALSLARWRQRRWASSPDRGW